MYEFQASARDNGKKVTLIGFAIMSIGLAFIAMMLSGGLLAAGILLLPIIALCLMVLCGLFFFATGIKQIIKGGEFHIKSSPQGISWLIPSYLGESFQYRIHDLLCVKKITRIKEKKDGEIKTKIKYVLVAKNDTEHKLLKHSDVSIEDVVKSLTSAGLELRESTIHPN